MKTLQRWVPGYTTVREYQPRVAAVGPGRGRRPRLPSWCPRAWPTPSSPVCPPVTGLYTTIACLVAYAIFGPSKVLVLGPDSSVSPLILASITPLLAGRDPASAIALAGMLALLVGLIEIGLGLAKLGFVADLLSSEVRVGYLNGLAVTIIVGQLPKLLRVLDRRRRLLRGGRCDLQQPRRDQRPRRS